MENGEIETKFLAHQQMGIEEVYDLDRILPSPNTQVSGTIDGILGHVVVKKGVEIQVRHLTHVSLEATDLNLGLLVHLADKLLTILELHLEFSFFLTVEIRSLLMTKHCYLFVYVA